MWFTFAMDQRTHIDCYPFLYVSSDAWDLYSCNEWSCSWIVSYDSEVDEFLFDCKILNLKVNRNRAMAVSITLLYGRIGTVIASNTVGSLLEYSCDATFLTFVVICFGKL
jgi:hypothetical protein